MLGSFRDTDPSSVEVSCSCSESAIVVAAQLNVSVLFPSIHVVLSPNSVCLDTH